MSRDELAQPPILLRRTSWLTLALEVVRAAFATIGVLLAAGSAALAIDAVFGLYPAGLIAVDGLIGCLLLAAAGFVGSQFWRNRFNPRRVARQIELRLGVQDSRLINSVDLMESPAGGHSDLLVRESVQRGEDLAAQVSSIEAVDLWRPWKMAAAAFGAIVVLVAAYLARHRASRHGRAPVPRSDGRPSALHADSLRHRRFSADGVPGKTSQPHRAASTDPICPTGPILVFVDGKEHQPLPMFRSEDRDQTKPASYCASMVAGRISVPRVKPWVVSAASSIPGRRRSPSRWRSWRRPTTGAGAAHSCSTGCCST